jgi:hypothetical protein
MDQTHAGPPPKTGASTLQSPSPVVVAIVDCKTWRKSLDNVLQQIRVSNRTSRERSLVITKIQEAIHWLGEDLKSIRPLVTLADQFDLARAAYLRYGAVTEFKNFRGDPMPAFDELPDKIKAAWVAATDPTASPYTNSYNPENTTIDPTADGLKL